MAEEPDKASSSSRGKRGTRGGAAAGTGTNGRPEGGRPRAASTPPRAGGGRKSVLEKELHEFLVNVSGLVLMSGDEFCSTVIQTNAEPLAAAYYRLAQKHDGVKRLLEALTRGSDFGTAAMLTAGTLIPILAHHGYLPEKMLLPYVAMYGMVPPSDEVAGHGHGTGGTVADEPAQGRQDEPPRATDN